MPQRDPRAPQRDPRASPRDPRAPQRDPRAPIRDQRAPQKDPRAPQRDLIVLEENMLLILTQEKHAVLYIYKAFSYNYKGKYKIGVTHKKWDLNAKYQYKVVCLPKP